MIKVPVPSVVYSSPDIEGAAKAPEAERPLTAPQPNDAHVLADVLTLKNASHVPTFSSVHNKRAASAPVKAPGVDYKKRKRTSDSFAPALPALPNELSFAILDRAKLNPLQLMALIDDRGDAPDHSLQQMAGTNAYWAAFTPSEVRSDHAREGAYSQAFVARHNAMPPAHQKLLATLWAGRITPGDVSSHLLAIEPSIRDNFDVMQAAVSREGYTLEHATARLRADRGIVLAAVSNHGAALEFASDDLQADREIVMAAISQDGGALINACADLRADRGIVVAAVSQNGEALEDASGNLRADRGIVMAAVSQDGAALEFASHNLQADRGIVMAAVSQDGGALVYASVDLQTDDGIVMAAVRQNGAALEYASADLRANRGIVMAAIEQNGWALRHASADLRNDPLLKAIANATLSRLR